MEPFPHHINMTRHKDKILCLSNDPIIFMKDKARDLWHPHIDAIIITLCIIGIKVYWILVDDRSSANILFKLTLNIMNLIGAKFEPTALSLSGFIGDSVPSEGIFNLPVELGTSPYQHFQAMDFVIVNCPSSYNPIIGRSKLNQIRVITST